MDFYKQIADYYEDIFPLNFAQLNFARKSFRDTSTLSVLDIGCGTGSLSAELAKYFQSVTAIDLDEAMLKKALKKKQSNIRYQKLNMLEIDHEFGKNSFDAVICFGNTIVHLEGAEQVKHFLKQVKNVLNPSGKFLFQIINYDRIIEQSVKCLPTIENDAIKFVRNYNYQPLKNIVDFETILTIKSSGKEIKNRIPLYPLRKSEIESFLNSAGFSEVHFYGNFKKDTLSKKSIPLVVETS